MHIGLMYKEFILHASSTIQIRADIWQFENNGIFSLDTCEIPFIPTLTRGYSGQPIFLFAGANIVISISTLVGRFGRIWHQLGFVGLAGEIVLHLLIQCQYFHSTIDKAKIKRSAVIIVRHYPYSVG